MNFLKRFWNWLTSPKKQTEQGVSPSEPVTVIPVTPAPEPITANPQSKYEVLLNIARQEIGVAEAPGSKENKRIAEYAKATSYGRELGSSYRDSTVSWCAMFVNWCLLQMKERRTDSAAAISFLSWGVALKEPVPGCVVVLKHPSGNHHVTLYLAGHGSGRIHGLGGNQNNSVNPNGAWDESEVMGYRGFKE